MSLDSGFVPEVPLFPAGMPPPTAPDAEKCEVCGEEMIFSMQIVIHFPCGHDVHFGCGQKWATQDRCFVCRNRKRPALIPLISVAGGELERAQREAVERMVGALPVDEDRVTTKISVDAFVAFKIKAPNVFSCVGIRKWSTLTKIGLRKDHVMRAAETGFSLRFLTTAYGVSPLKVCLDLGLDAGDIAALEESAAGLKILGIDADALVYDLRMTPAQMGMFRFSVDEWFEVLELTAESLLSVVRNPRDVIDAKLDVFVLTDRLDDKALCEIGIDYNTMTGALKTIKRT